MLARQHYGPAKRPKQDDRLVGIPLGNLVQRAVDADSQIRLVAWTDDELPGVSITPHVAQSRVANMIVAQLDYGPLAEPQPDVNLPPTAQHYSRTVTESNSR